MSSSEEPQVRGGDCRDPAARVSSGGAQVGVEIQSIETVLVVGDHARLPANTRAIQATGPAELPPGIDHDLLKPCEPLSRDVLARPTTTGIGAAATR